MQPPLVAASVRALPQLAVLLIIAAFGAAFTGSQPRARAAAPAAPVELPGKRTAFSQTFQNPDGSLTTSVYGAPVHYRDGSGKWQRIDSTLMQSGKPGYAWRNRGNAFHVFFKQALGGDYAQIETGPWRVDLSLEGATPARGRAKGSHVSYAGALDGVDLEYDLSAVGLEESLVLKDASSPTRFRFLLAQSAGPDLRAGRQPDGSWGFYAAPRHAPVFVLERPRALETPNGEEIGVEPDGHASISVRKRPGGFTIDLAVDAEWLRDPDRRFPVVVDPTLTIQPSVEDVSWAVGNYLPLTDPLLYIGSSSSYIYRAGVKFDLSAIPAGAPVTDARLRLYWEPRCLLTKKTAPFCNNGGQVMDAHRITSAWTTSTPTPQVTYDSTRLDTYTLPTCPCFDPAWLTWSVTNTVKGWLDRTLPNNGVLLKLRTEVTNASGPAAFGRRYTGEKTLLPRLDVTYSGDAVDLLPPSTLHANGADLAWTPYQGMSGAPFERYEVHRSSTPAFTPSSSTLVATIGDASITTYRDTTGAPGKTFTYKVVANSSASNEQTVTLPGDGQASKVLQLDPASGQAVSITWFTGITNCGNYGSEDLIYVGPQSDGINRGLLSFDLRDIPTSASITSATMALWNPYVPSTNPVRAYRMTRAWREGTGVTACTGDGATWYESDGGVSWSKQGADFDPTARATAARADSTDWESYDLTGLVRDWVRGTTPNLGVLLKADDETLGSDKLTDYASDDYTVTPTLRPKLTIVYADGSHAIAPTVAIGSPAAGDDVSGTVTVTVGASDDGRVAKVDLLVDGSVVATSTGAPFRLDWNTTAFGDGDHTLKAAATDNAGLQTTSADVTVRVDNSAAPSTSITSPANGATVSGTVTVTATAGDDHGVTLVEFYVDGNRFAATATSPYGATLDTTSATAPVYDGSHTLTTKAYDGGGHVTVSAAVTIIVRNAPSGSPYDAGYSSTEVPQGLTYDPGAGNQDQFGVDVTVTNRSTVTWSSGSIVLRYRWVSSDSTPAFDDGPNVPLSSDVGPGGSQTVRVLATPPTLPDGVERAKYILRFDLYDKASGSWFAGKGVQPLENPVIVNKALVREALGLERYYHYVGRDMGAGMQQLTNVANGNSILRWTPFDEDGRGLSTVLDLTYNALEKKCDCPAGNNWSLAISSLNRFGNPIDIHPNKADQIAGNSNKYVDITDGDGTTHRFRDANNDGYWEAPAGVHLYLRPTGSGDPNRYWALTRPDRVTFYYTQDGYPTSVVDGNGNSLTFEESPVAPADDPGGPKFKVTKVTDAGGRSFTIVYYTKADAKKPHIRGKVKSITDHVGRELRFDYYFDGNLLRITQKGGLNPDGTGLDDRSFVFRYTTSDGSGPADAGSDPANPDPGTANQSTRIYSVRDPRGHETTFSYLGPGAGTDRWKLASITERSGAQTTFGYDTGNRVTTVTEPLDRVSRYAYDVEGKVTTITNPLGQQTTVSWSDDRAVSRVTEPTGVTSSYSYNANGYLTSVANQLGNRTELTYEDSPVDANDSSAHWEAGRSIPHISDLRTKTDPNGVATTEIPDDYQWTFAHDGNGNVTAVTDPLGKTTTNAYNGDGTLASTNDANGHVTSFLDYDANGLPTTVVDPLGNETGDAVHHRTTFVYNAAGELLSVQDAVHQDFGAAARTNASFFDYDPFGRLVRQSTPKSTSLEPGNLIWSSASFDENDNVVSQTYPHYAPSDSGGAGGDKTTMAYDDMDRLKSQVVPHDPSSTDPVQGSRTTTYAYDAAGRLLVRTDPKGVLTTSTDKDFATFYDYDLLDRVVAQTRYQVDAATGAVTATQSVRACYDLAGDLRSVTAPKGDAAFPGCPAPAIPYTPLSGNFTTSFTYDAAHRLIASKDPLGDTQSLTYDANGDADSFTDENGTRSTRTYDQRGHVIAETQPFRSGKDLVTRFEYDPVGNVSRVVSPRAYDASADKQTFAQFVTRFEYDANDRLTRELMPTSGTDTQQLYVHHAYDGVGREAWTSLTTDQALPGSVPDGEQSQFGYWDAGWLRRSKNPTEPEVTFDWNALGLQAARTRNGNTERWSYFADGQLREQRDPDGDPTTYSYDANGNLQRLDDSAGAQSPDETPLVAEQTFDGFNQLTKTRQQKLGQPWRVTTYGYDLNGNVLRETDDAGEDALGNPTGGRTIDFTYDAADHVVEQIDHGLQTGCGDDQRLQYVYRASDEIADQVVSRAGTSCTDTAPGWGVKEQTSRTYFLNGLPSTLKIWNGAAATATLVQTHTLAYEDASGVYQNGNVASDRTGIASPLAPCPVADPCTLTYGYDAKDRLTTYENGRGGSTTYSLLPNGMLGTESFDNPTIFWTKTYGYNAQNGVQLRSIRRVQTLPTASTRTQRFFYDRGNLFCVGQDDAQQAIRSDCTVAEGATPSSRLTASYAYDDLDRISAAHFYDTGTETDSAQWTFDALDRVSSEREAHAVPAINRTIGFDYVGLTSDVAKETWTGSFATTKSYGYDAFGNKASLTDSGSSRNLLYGYNPHGDVSQLLDVTGTATAAYGYRPYGDEEQGSNAISQGDPFDRRDPYNLYRYSAKRYDTGAGAIDMGARMFSPDYGSFLQEDYLRDALGDLDLATDPLTSTRYSLTGGNPVNFIEVSGHGARPAAGSIRCVRGGRLYCTLAAFRWASWNDRISWLRTVQKYHPFIQGWLNVFIGTVKFFRDSLFSGEKIARRSDAGVLWVIERGLAGAISGNDLSQAPRAARSWRRFFRGLRTGASVAELKRRWGTAEHQGVEFGLGLTRGLSFSGGKWWQRILDPHLQPALEALWSGFIDIGNSYRNALRTGRAVYWPIPGMHIGKHVPDPVHDANWVYSKAMLFQNIMWPIFYGGGG